MKLHELFNMLNKLYFLCFYNVERALLERSFYVFTVELS